MLINAFNGFGGMFSGAATDPHFANVVSLMHFDTGNTTITDIISNKTWTAAGNASANGTAKFGTYALALDGAGDYISTPDSTDFTLTGDFTIECWLYLNSNAVLATVFDGRSSAGLGDFVFSVYNTAGGQRLDWIASGARTTPTDIDVPLGQYNHLAVCRSSGVIRFFLNGVSSSTTSSNAATIDPAGILNVGRTYDNAYFVNGLIDDVRITNGVARYAGNFTPPTAAFPDA